MLELRYFLYGSSKRQQLLFRRQSLTDWFLGAFAKLRKFAISYVMSFCPFAWNNSVLTGRIFVKLDIRIFPKSIDKIQVLFNLKRIPGSVRYMKTCVHL